MVPGSRTLVLVRHGQSSDNEQNLFSGFRNPDLTDRGVAEAKAAGRRLKELGLRFELAFTSKLRRAQRTLAIILEELALADLPVEVDEALNERHYGELSGLNKAEACTQWSPEQVHLWRKTYEAVPPGGESLAMTAARTVPFYERQIAWRLQAEQQVLIVAHGNSLRSLVMHLEELSPEAIITRNIATSEILIYTFGASGGMSSKVSVLAD
ncbi:2,3-bisphosphoglycerate-dependent phosphoglycerate mutase [Methylobacterium iners]|uniref:2,3-bisphosphoglycerate-dependent phosphoglycerate mutase n=1 Tax=Methylobacterium iners TaxID=418707 RepID=A0ABQ4RXS3_9HYPH|nr:2,3-bisphosphoglycerate-dependent phosphoglycerate mutase [Methylobacterium iners]GJD94772.1 2,3-bisphosphoglycerate-dependent phosphoglycerate mutase [Methylobacterium iners]